MDITFPTFYTKEEITSEFDELDTELFVSNLTKHNFCCIYTTEIYINVRKIIYETLLNVENHIALDKLELLFEHNRHADFSYELSTYLLSKIHTLIDNRENAKQVFRNIKICDPNIKKNILAISRIHQSKTWKRYKKVPLPDPVNTIKMYHSIMKKQNIQMENQLIKLRENFTIHQLQSQ